MSTQIAMLCALCKEVLNSQDDIFGTSCGHLYHFLCLRECHGQSTNCSHCDSYKPCMFKMFLEFGEATLSWEEQVKTIELHNELQESKSTLARLEEKHKFSKVTMQKLEGKLKKFDDALKSKDCTVADLEDRISTLEELNKFLTTDKELKTSKDDKTEEFEEQNYKLSKNKLKNLNKKNLATLLEKEIAKNLELSKNNIKLKALNQLTNNDDGNVTKNLPEYAEGKNKNVAIKNLNENYKVTQENAADNTKHESEPKAINVNSKENGEIIQKKVEQTDPQLTDDSHKVLICNYLAKDLENPLEKVVISIASKMGITLSSREITRVIAIKKNLNLVTLLVIFENIDQRREFILNKNRLKEFPTTRFLEICAENFQKNQ